MGQTQIRTTKYGLYDVIRIKKDRIYTDTLIIYTSLYESLNDFDAQRDFGKIFVIKKLLLS